MFVASVLIAKWHLVANSNRWCTTIFSIYYPFKQKSTLSWLHHSFIAFAFILCLFLSSISSIKMIGLAQGPGPCVSRRSVFESSLSCVNIHQFASIAGTSSVVSPNCLSLCVSTDNQIEVLRSVGPLIAAAQISRSAWSQWDVVRPITATTRVR